MESDGSMWVSLWYATPLIRGIVLFIMGIMVGGIWAEQIFKGREKDG